jgi:hypothetical protein
MKLHLEHPTQAAACGVAANCVGKVFAPEEFRALASESQCARCRRVLTAIGAGRLVYSGYEDGTGDRGVRRVTL